MTVVVCNNTGGFTALVDYFFSFCSVASSRLWDTFPYIWMYQIRRQGLFLTNSNLTGGVMKRERIHSPVFKVSYPMTRNSKCFASLLNAKLFPLNAMIHALL